MAAFLQSYVIPVCLYSEGNGQATIKELMGSAFFLNTEGIFLTAGHVIQGAIERSAATDLRIGLCQKADRGTSAQSVMCQIVEHEFAPPPYDIAIGRSSTGSETLLRLDNVDISVWQDVAAFGYPLSIVNTDANRFDIGLRCHKGHIQRIVQAGEIKISPNPAAFELSFSISRGLSGSPLFVHRNPKDVVIGVCIGSVRSEITDSEIVEVNDAGKQFRESRLKIEEFGLAHDIRGLHTWSPKILGGKSLFEVSL